MLRAGRVIACTLAAALVLVAPAHAQQPVPSSPVVIDGPDPNIALPSGLGTSVARDGSGGLVYLKAVGGVEHVFVSSLVGGTFSGPLEVDSALSTSASSPVIAAGNGGLLLIGFVSGGELYVSSRASPSAPFTPPRGLSAAAASPAIAITNLGKAYLAFTVAAGGGYDVRTAYYHAGTWGLESAPLNATPADDAGTGTGRPAVAAAGDGVGIVVWGEHGDVIARRVWGTAPSIVAEQADGPLPGCNDVSADDPVVGTEGDSSYADVAFHEVLTCGGVQQSRVLVNRLQGSRYLGLTASDGLASGSSGQATDPQITMGEYGHGLITSERSQTNDGFVTVLGDGGAPSGRSTLSGEPNSLAPDPVPATAGLFSNLVAWQQAPTASGGAGIVVRYAPNGSSLGPEMTVSSPAQGTTDAPDGLAATGDVDGDTLVAWVQTSASEPQIVAARLYQPPGGFGAAQARQYQRSDEARLRWLPAQEAWGPVTYSVSVDGAQVGQTTSTSFVVPTALADGPHTWQATAANPAGQQSSMRPAAVFLDTVPPTVTLLARARVKLGTRAKLQVTYVDLPPAGESATDASGVAKVVIRWGDGSSTTLVVGKHFVLHLYRRARRYTIRVTVADVAGNSTMVTRPVRVFKPAAKHPKPAPGTHP